MSHAVTAVVIGVAAPAPFTYRGNKYAFHSLEGVRNDLAWYEQLLSTNIAADRLDLLVLDAPAETTVTHLTSVLTSAIANVSAGDTFILILCGHGFQVADVNEDKPAQDDDITDKHDEVFAAQDGPILDDFFGSLWTKTPLEADVIVITDTCSADGLGILGGRNIEPVIVQSATGPSRLFISASMSWEKAGEYPSRVGARGVLSAALQDAWEAIPAARTSYLSWFRESLELLSVRRPQQHPRLRYLGPNQNLPTTKPFD